MESPALSPDRDRILTFPCAFCGQQSVSTKDYGIDAFYALAWHLWSRHFTNGWILPTCVCGFAILDNRRSLDDRRSLDEDMIAFAEHLRQQEDLAGHLRFGALGQ